MIHAADCDRGYDPSTREPIPVERVRLLDKLPSAAIVNPAFLPPVGTQGTTAQEGAPGSCCAWASVYGLATFTAARAGRVDPSHPAGQASPAQIYVEVLQERGVAVGTCGDTSFADYFAILDKAGAQSLADAPYMPDCTSLWLAYSTLPAAARDVFRLRAQSSVETSDLDSVKHIVASGRVLCFGTRLFSDFSSYTGGTYWGNGDILMSRKTGKPAGHCMLIIGYDDTTQALLIQNSEGAVWGIGGRIWMAYSTFQFLAQGQAIFEKDW